MSNTEEVKQDVVNFIRQELSYGDKLDDDMDLISTGVLDSLNLLRLVSFLEKKFKVKIDDDDLAPQNFRTLSAICAYVAKIQA